MKKQKIKKQRSRQSTSKQVDPVTKRMVEMTFAPFDEVIDWLVRVIKVEIISKDQNSEDKVDGVVTVKNPYLKMTSALNSKVDPVTRAVCLGFITAGPYWPHTYPALLEEVNKEWRKRQRKALASIKAEVKEAEEDQPQVIPKKQSIQLPPGHNGAAPTFEEVFRQEQVSAHETLIG